MNYASNRAISRRQALCPVSNSNGTILNINMTRILEKKADWRPKNDHTHSRSLIPLCTYGGRTKRSKEPLRPDPLPPSGSQKGGGAGYARLYYSVLQYTFTDASSDHSLSCSLIESLWLKPVPLQIPFQ